MIDQPDLFATPPALPAGFRHADAVLPANVERELADRIAALDLKPFAFRGFVGNRRTISFGWHYDFEGHGLARAAPMPDFLLEARAIAAGFAGHPPEALEHALLTEYAPGAGIGWHRDRPNFGDVLAISLLAPCRLRFRVKRGGGWDRAAIMAEPRSIYVLSGPSRDRWEHSIPALDRLRYSLTFRTLREPVRIA